MMNKRIRASVFLLPSVLLLLSADVMARSPVLEEIVITAQEA